MIVNKKLKLILIVFLIVTFFSIAYYAIQNDKLWNAKYIDEQDVDVVKIKESLKKINNVNLIILVNQNKTYYDLEENKYYYYVNNSSNTNLNLTITNSKKYNYTILNSNPSSNNHEIDLEKEIKLLIFNDKEYFETEIKFTQIPILSITTTSNITNILTDISLELYGYNENNHFYLFTSDAEIRIRGQSSSNYPKKGYRIALKKGKNKNFASLLNMREDEDWILDSMYSDFSKMRNKLAFDLWNQINSYTKDYTDNDLKLEYVDVYINGKYNGLYLLKEPLDWKTLSLEETSKYDSGILFKGITYGSVDNKTYEENKKNSTYIAPFEIMYPNNVKNYSKYWDNLMDRVYNYYFDSSIIDDQYIYDTFELYNFVDYRMFVKLIMAVDNLNTKNVYLSIKNMNKNTKVIMTPWDLDMTFGLVWSGVSPTLLKTDYSNYNNINILENNLNKVNEVIKERYLELRKSILSIENVNNLIDSYYNQIKYSVKRDNNIWLESDLRIEIENLKTWYENRVNYLDLEVGGLNV